MENRIDLTGLPKNTVTSRVHAVRARMNGANEFLVWSLPIEQNAFRTITEDVTTPRVGGNKETIDISNVVEATFDVYTLPEGSKYPQAWFLQSVKRHDGSVTSYEFGELDLESIEL